MINYKKNHIFAFLNIRKMKKINLFLILVLISIFTFAQTEKLTRGNLQSVPVNKKSSYPVNDSKAIVDSLHYDGNNDDGIGTGGANTFGAYAFFPHDSLQPFVGTGNDIMSVKLFINGASNVTSAQIEIYDNNTNPALYTQVFTPVEGWNNVLLTTPMTIPASGNLYIGYKITVTGGYPLGCDAGPVAAGGNGNWILFNGTWQHLTALSASLTVNWNIRVMIGSPAAVPTAYCTPLSYDAGTVVVNESATSANFTLSNTGTGNLTCTGISGISAPWTTTFNPASVNLAYGASNTFTFTYAPTAAGTNNQTVVIATNGGDITINLSGNAITCDPISTFPWVESFEGATFPPACWTKATPDGGTGWEQIANGTSPLPGWTGGTMTVPTGGGSNAAYATWTTGGSTENDQWLITPAVAVQNNQSLSFYVFWFGHYTDLLDIKVSTTDKNLSSFTTTLLSIDTTALTHNDWKKFEIPLTAYAGQTVYFAFNEHVADNYDDGAFLGLDLVTIDVATSNNEIEAQTINVFPNPANDILFVDAKDVKQIKIFDVVGNLVAEYGNVKTINTSSLGNGTYFILVITEENISKSIINITH